MPRITYAGAGHELELLAKKFDDWLKREAARPARRSAPGAITSTDSKRTPRKEKNRSEFLIGTKPTHSHAIIRPRDLARNRNAWRRFRS